MLIGRQHQVIFFSLASMSPFPVKGAFCLLLISCLFVSSRSQQTAEGFECSSGVFLPADHVCDFTDQCGDNGDELQCECLPVLHVSLLASWNRDAMVCLGDHSTFLVLRGFYAVCCQYKLETRMYRSMKKWAITLKIFWAVSNYWDSSWSVYFRSVFILFPLILK